VFDPLSAKFQLYPYKTSGCVDQFCSACDYSTNPTNPNGNSKQ